MTSFYRGLPAEIRDMKAVGYISRSTLVDSSRSIITAMRGPLWVEIRCPGNTRTGILCGAGAPRVRLDIHADDLDAEVARLERLGAERVQKVQTWWVMRDPAGLLFCVLPVSPGSLNDGKPGAGSDHDC